MYMFSCDILTNTHPKDHLLKKLVDFFLEFGEKYKFFYRDEKRKEFKCLLFNETTNLFEDEPNYLFEVSCISWINADIDKTEIERHIQNNECSHEPKVFPSTELLVEHYLDCHPDKLYEFFLTIEAEKKWLTKMPLLTNAHEVKRSWDIVSTYLPLRKRISQLLDLFGEENELILTSNHHDYDEKKESETHYLCAFSIDERYLEDTLVILKNCLQFEKHDEGGYRDLQHEYQGKRDDKDEQKDQLDSRDHKDQYSIGDRNDSGDREDPNIQGGAQDDEVKRGDSRKNLLNEWLNIRAGLRKEMLRKCRMKRISGEPSRFKSKQSLINHYFVYHLNELVEFLEYISSEHQKDPLAAGSNNRCPSSHDSSGCKLHRSAEKLIPDLNEILINRGLLVPK